MSDTHNKLKYGNKYNQWKILDLLLDLNYISFSNPNYTLTRRTYLNTKPAMSNRRTSGRMRPNWRFCAAQLRFCCSKYALNLVS